MDIEGHSVKILETSLEPSSHSIPVSCSEDTTLYVTRVQPAGKKPMAADDWRRGIH